MENHKEEGVKAEDKVWDLLGGYPYVQGSIEEHYDLLFYDIPVEVKEAKHLIIHHGHYDYGRFKITLKNHKKLVEDNGYYFFVIRNSNKRYYYMSARELEDKLKLLNRKNRYAGISTRWVILNCRQFSKEEFLKEIGKGDGK